MRAERAQSGRREGAERTGELERPCEDAAVHAAAVGSALRCGGGARARVRPATVEDPRKHLAGPGDEAVARRRSEQRASWWAFWVGCVGCVWVGGGGAAWGEGSAGERGVRVARASRRRSPRRLRVHRGVHHGVHHAGHYGLHYV